MIASRPQHRNRPQKGRLQRCIFLMHMQRFGRLVGGRVAICGLRITLCRCGSRGVVLDLRWWAVVSLLCVSAKRARFSTSSTFVTSNRAAIFRNIPYSIQASTIRTLQNKHPIRHGHLYMHLRTAHAHQSLQKTHKCLTAKRATSSQYAAHCDYRQACTLIDFWRLLQRQNQSCIQSTLD